MADLRIQVESRDGLCLLRVSGELHLLSVEEFVEGAGQAMRAVPGPVLVNLSDLTFIDVRGACALAAAAQPSPAGRQVVIGSCPPRVRLVLDVLGLSLNYRPADCLPARISGRRRPAPGSVLSHGHAAQARSSVPRAPIG